MTIEKNQSGYLIYAIIDGVYTSRRYVLCSKIDAVISYCNEFLNGKIPSGIYWDIRADTCIRLKNSTYYNVLSELGQLSGNVDHMKFFRDAIINNLKSEDKKLKNKDKTK